MKKFNDDFESEYSIVKKTKIKKKESIKDLIKQEAKKEVFKQITTEIKQLSEMDIEIAEHIANNKSKEWIKSSYNIDDEYYQNLVSSPAFNTELKQVTLEKTFASKDVRIRQNNALNNEVFRILIDKLNDANEVKKIGIDRLFKVYEGLMTAQSKMVDGDDTTVSVDITQIITQRQRDENTVKQTGDGEFVIKSKYPTLDAETGEIIDG